MYLPTIFSPIFCLFFCVGFAGVTKTIQKKQEKLIFVKNKIKIVCHKLAICIENEEREDIVIIFADPSVKVQFTKIILVHTKCEIFLTQ